MSCQKESVPNRFSTVRNLVSTDLDRNDAPLFFEAVVINGAFHFYNLLALIMNVVFDGRAHPINAHLLLLAVGTRTHLFVWVMIFMATCQFAWGTLQLGLESLHFVW